MYNAHQKLNQINMCRRSTKQNTLHTYVYKCTFKSPVYSIYIDTHRGAHNWYASTHARPLSGMHYVTWVTTTHWSATLTFAPCKEKANGAGAEEFIFLFFLKSRQAMMCRGLRRMISAPKCALCGNVRVTHCGELHKIVPFVRYPNTQWSSGCGLIKK